jgi:hypothetical protein
MEHIVQASAVSWWLCRGVAPALVVLLALLIPTTVFARGGDITAAAMGSIYDYNSLQGREVPPGGAGGPSSGDNWESCWGADDSFFVVRDDGFGFGYGIPGVAPYVPGLIKPDGDGVVPNVNHGLCKVEGHPDASTESVRGINLNPGLYSYTLPATYSRDIYEVDGVLYAVKLYSNQGDKDFDGIHFDFFNVSLMKSTDGGRNWYNNLGQLNTPPPNNREQCMFPDYRMSWPAFIHYGKGGDAPASDNADKYVYLVSYDSFGGRAKNPDPRGAYLARIPRARLASLDKNDVQYFKGGDGMDDESWSHNAADSRPVLSVPYVMPKVVYSYAFKRYLICDERIDGVTLYTARHPWGPWTKLVSHLLPGTYWGSLACNKWTSPDGKKMWYVATGGYRGTLYPYGFLFNPVYLSGGVVDVYEAADARRTGALTVENDPSSDEKGYVTGLAKIGDGLRFQIKRIHGKGWHIIRFQYASRNKDGNSVSIFVNGRKMQLIDRLCYSYEAGRRRPHDKWLDHSGIYYLNNGTNTFEIRMETGDNGNGLMIRRLYVSREKTYDEGENLALQATARASSAAPGSRAGAVNDGCASGGASEWVSNNESAGSWAQLNWSDPVTIDKIVLYDRPDPGHRVSRGTLTFSDGSTAIAVGHLQDDGRAGTVITFPPKTVSWVRFTIDRSDSSESGLAEFEVYGALKKSK